MKICPSCECVIVGEPAYCTDCDHEHCETCVIPVKDEMVTRYGEAVLDGERGTI